MKKTKLAFIAILSITTLFIAGCAGTLQKHEGQPQVISQPVYSADPQTGLLVQIGTTNLVATANTYTINSNIAASLAAAQALTAAGASVPSPASPFFALATVLLGAVSSGLGLYARKKSGQLTLSNAALAATTLVIETAENAAALKEKARQTATANGSGDYLHEQVKNL